MRTSGRAMRGAERLVLSGANKSRVVGSACLACCLLVGASGCRSNESAPGDASPAEASAATDGGLLASDATIPDGALVDATSSGMTDDSASPDSGRGDAALLRDPLQQPFSSGSIWNTPIGSSAQYVPANIHPSTSTTLESDWDVIVLTPGAPSTAVATNTADWNTTQNRCPVQGPVLFSGPIPADYVIDTPVGQTPNAGLAVLLADGRTLKQTQPFARCTAGATATSHYVFPDQDLYGLGSLGAHGGSGLSAIGGTLRLGELRPGMPPPAHALKLELFAKENYYNDGNTADCFRWPAVDCDSYFNDATSPLKYGGTNPALKPGSLLALPPSVSIASLGLQTEPAKLLATTLQGFGAYLVDDTAWSATAICVEHGPSGTFEQQFQSDWGLSIDTSGTTSSFALDMAKVVASLEVVNNNSASSIGGGGNPIVPPPPLPAPPADQ
jgi:hypothetical protein